MKSILEFLSSKMFKLILVILIVIIVIIFIASSNTDNKEEKEEIPTEIVVDSKIEAELERKIALLKYASFCDIETTTNIYNNDCLYRKDITLPNDLNEIYRLYVLTLAKDELLENKNNTIVGRIKVDGIEFKNTQQFYIKEFEKEYKDLYGQEEPFNPLAVNQVNKFPYVKFDETRNRIFYQTTGEKVEYNPNYIDEFIENYESDKENVYVYVNIAYIAPTGAGVYGVYTEPEKNILVKNISKKEYESKDVITDLNSNKFRSYKYTFTKETNGNLKFTKVEKIQ